jgi:hypothetical protein
MPVPAGVLEVWPATARPASWDRATYPDCPGEPAADTAPHGINLRSTGPGRAIIYAVAHGPRESVEVFDLDSAGAQPVLTWIGCAVLPVGTSGNGVAALPGGEGFVVTNYLDPTNPDPFAPMFAGQITGDVRLWQAGAGWSTVAGSGLGGPNGIEISPDGTTLYVSAWPARQVVRIPLAGGPANAQADLPFLPDNLRWTAVGTLLVTGQVFDYDNLMTCAGQGSNCPVGYQIVEIDPTTMTPSSRFTSDDPAFGLATVAAPVGDEVWVGGLGADRIARVRF